jgi:hypothetical protein
MQTITHAALQTAETRLRLLGFKFIDIGCFERSDGMTLQLGALTDGLIIRPLCPKTMEPIAPNYLLETDQDFEQALLLLGAVGNRDIQP